MDEKIAELKFIFVAISGPIFNLLGGFDKWLSALVLFVCVDYLTGIVKAIMQKSEKSKNHGLDSTVMFYGGIRKVLIFFVVAVATVSDRLISPTSTTIRSLVIAYYVATEGLSITENIAACGVPVPKKLISVLEKLRNDETEEPIKKKERK